jgi:IS30 family transposase
MEFSRKEKEGILLDLYHNKGCTYRPIAEELRMSFNQISDILKRHEERNNAIANKKKELSLSSKAYKLFSKGKTNVEVIIKLDVPPAQVFQFRLEYCKLQDLDNFESLYRMTNGNVDRLLALHREW